MAFLGLALVITRSLIFIEITQQTCMIKVYHTTTCRDLETGDRCHSKLLEMAPFDRLYTTFYWSAIVSIPVYYTIFKLFDVK